jgi:hypothetical protein
MAKNVKAQIEELNKRICMLEGLLMQLAGELFFDEDGNVVMFDTLDEIEDACAESREHNRRTKTIESLLKGPAPAV